jgi:group I intron endonuclease
MHYLYKITDALNNKVYIGQTIDNKKRWMQHKAYAKRPDKTGQYIHRAMAKYGVENFSFEIIATCQTQEDADETESLLIIQYNSRSKDYGYNLMVGGSHGGHSEETKQKQRDATLNQIATQGHPAQGRIVTQEEKELHRKARLDNPIEYTSELRQRMSEAHIGIKDSDETKKNKADSAKAAWEKRQAAAIASGELKCNAPGCAVSGVITGKYYFVNDIRYCSKHAQRLKRTGRL